jgi:alpha-tubulin suppressor-like RCC1 family protein
MSSDTSTTVTSPITTQQQQSPSIESLYQQANMMNTNQLLFNTNLQQQQYLQQMQHANQFNAMTSLPFNTISNIGMGQNNMFATGTPNNIYATGVNTLGMTGFNPINFGIGSGITMNPTMGQATVNTSLPVTSNPNFQINPSFQTGNINLNQLYQTNQMGLTVTPTVQNT